MDKVLLSIDLLGSIVEYLGAKDIKNLLLCRKNVYKIGYNLRFLKNVSIDNIATIHRLAHQLYPSPYMNKISLKNIPDVNIHLPMLPKECILLNCTFNHFFKSIPHKLSPELKYLVVDTSSEIFLDFKNMPNIKSITIRCLGVKYSKDYLTKCKDLVRVNVDSIYASDLTCSIDTRQKNNRRNRNNYISV